jgi:hypothetical protein
MSDQSLKFNWHEEPDNLLKYAWITLMSEVDHDELFLVTDRGKSIELSIYANGVEMNAQNFMDCLKHNYDHAVRRGIKAALAEIRFEELTATIRTAEREAVHKVRELFKERGIEWEEEDEW